MGKIKVIGALSSTVTRAVVVVPEEILSCGLAEEDIRNRYRFGHLALRLPLPVLVLLDYQRPNLLLLQHCQYYCYTTSYGRNSCQVSKVVPRDCSRSVLALR